MMSGSWRIVRAGLLAVVLAVAGGAAAAVLAQQQDTACIRCHSDADLFEADEVAIVSQHAEGVHASVGLSCQDCHGGNPDPALFEDPSESMDPDFAPNPFVGVPETADVPEFCGRCHADAAYMRGFRPDIRVDQLAEYRTSRHGQLLATGDTSVATCISCHGVHDIRRPTDSDSRVFPTRVAETCSACHADARLMAGRTTADGLPLPVDQYARWKQSVHANALLEREDLSAPTCNDCHGNHGAAPPGLDSINFVCGQCHGREASLFRASRKRVGFEDHNEYLADAGEEGCAACHADPEPQAKRTGIHHLSECATCHGSHGIVRPTLAMLSPLPDTPCYFCHEGAAAPVQEDQAVESHYAELRDQLLGEAASLGLEGDERFDWLVDRAQALPTHRREGGPESGPGPEFLRLFEKFRIGKTSYEYEDPQTGEPTRAHVFRCGSCHASEDYLGEDAIGIRTSSAILSGMSELTSHTAAAERALLRARRGGVETRAATEAVEAAVDAQIQAEVLLHGFSAAEDSDFMAKQAEGMDQANTALAAGQDALRELWARRRGLFVALGLIVLVLAGLGLKIREISARRHAAPPV